MRRNLRSTAKRKRGSTNISTEKTSSSSLTMTLNSSRKTSELRLRKKEGFREMWTMIKESSLTKSKEFSRRTGEPEWMTMMKKSLTLQAESDREFPESMKVSMAQIKREPLSEAANSFKIP